ncbi:GPP34 family phosphoprotein [Pseudonocardia alni]|uniref:GOLPH3/VPS74 family protein n=1 Tax=Pseudonocardia alni TaxID=33907 RepID=UPI0027A2CABE|nr:GPP34 family phosphoprotein [Pseudonocardia alni]
MSDSRLLMSEEILLIALDDESGKTGFWYKPDTISAAAVCDLVDAGAITIDEKKKVRPTGGVPGHPGLRVAYELVAANDKERSVSHWVGVFNGKFSKTDGPVSRRLVADGVLSLEEGSLLRSARLRELDTGPERELRRRLATVLVGGAEPDAHDAVLISMLHTADMIVAAIAGEESADRRAGGKRAKAIQKELKNNPLVKAQYDAVIAATITSMAVAGAVITAGSN